ncbi:hypothetical protein D3C76_663820 [compost metagenome]
MRRAGPPSTKQPLEALSATVSTKRMFQPATRLPTISSAGSTQPVAASTSAKLVSARGRSRSRIRAISASIFGCSTRSMGTTSLSP